MIQSKIKTRVSEAFFDAPLSVHVVSGIDNTVWSQGHTHWPHILTHTLAHNKNYSFLCELSGDF